MRSLIVFEGIPGSGKTTLSKMMSLKTGIKIAERNHLNENTSEYEITNRLLLDKSEFPLIFDRFIWSDVVFSKILRNSDVLDYLERFKHFMSSKKIDYYLIYVHGLGKQTHSRFSDDQLKLMEDLYMTLMENEDCIDIDYSKIDIEDAIKKVMEVL